MLITTVDAKGLLDQWADELLVDYDTGAEGKTVEAILDDWIALQVNSNPLTKGTISDAIASEVRAIAIQEGSMLKNLWSLRETVGGYIYVNSSREINWETSIGEDKGQWFHYRLNMPGVERTIDYPKMVNKLYAFGAYAGDARITLGDSSNDFLTGGSATADTTQEGHEASKAFDDDEETYWTTDNSALPHWIKYDLGVGNSETAIFLRIKPYASWIKDFTLEGSNNDSDWDELLSTTAANNGNWQEWRFTNATAYRYYKLTITSNYGVQNYAVIYEIELKESNPYITDVDSQDTYGVKVKAITDRSITHPDTLLEWALLYLADHKDPVYTYAIDAVMLSELDDTSVDWYALQLGSTVKVIDDDLSISVDLTVVSISQADLDEPWNIQIELSNVVEDVADLLAEVYNAQQLEQHAAVKVGAGNVVISGVVTVNDWVSEGQTTINGGQITANTITAAKLTIVPIEEGGAAADINAGETTISGGKITTGSITATQIAAGAVDTSELAADAVTAEKIDVATLSAISADVGTLTSGTINGTTIYAGSENVKLDSGGIKLKQGASSYLLFTDASWVTKGGIYQTAAGVITIYNSVADKNIAFSLSGTGKVYTPSLDTGVLTVTALGSSLIPIPTGTYTLGSDTYRFNGGYSDGWFRIGKNDDNTDGIIPHSSDRGNIGHYDQAFRIGYFLYVGDAATKVAEMQCSNYAGCPMPTTNSAIGVIKKIGAPKVTEGHHGERHYFQDADFPDEMKFTPTALRPGQKIEDIEPEIELMRTLGICVQAIRELVDKVEALESRA